MFTTAIIAFREFLEAFLIIGVFLGVSRKLKLKKELEIMLASGIGIALSMVLTTATYIFGSNAQSILTEKSADFLESYLLIFSGVFIAYVVFSLHNVIAKNKKELIIKARSKLQSNAFDISLFLTITFLVLREGFEVALFSAATALFSTFLQNFTGMLIGFVFAAIVGVMTFFAYIKFPISKVFRLTEYMIILLGASLVQNGITKLFEIQFHVYLSKVFTLPMTFLPVEESVFGHLIQSLLGVDRDFSLGRLAIMIGYIGIVYLLFVRERVQKYEK